MGFNLGFKGLTWIGGGTPWFARVYRGSERRYGHNP